MSSQNSFTSVSDLLSAPWAIEPAKLLEIQAIYAARLRGEQIDLANVEARLGRPLANEQQEYSVHEGGVAVLPIEGVIAPKANLFTRVSGGVSAQMLMLQLESAMADSRVRSIILAIDSPGGSVFGTPELAGAVREFAAEKPIVTVSDATMASAAYWIGSAANAMFVTGPTVHVGSIGIVATHAYNPSRDGSTLTEITAGRYKRIASDTQPLSDEGRAYLQERVDHIYSIFVETVAQHRGASVADVLDRMADGRVFIGQQAVEAGLVDGIRSRDALMAEMASDPTRFAQRQRARRVRSSSAAVADAVPQAAAAAPRLSLSRQQMVDNAKRCAAAHGMDFLDAFKALGYAGDRPTVDVPAPAEALTKDQQVAAAKRYAAQHGVEFLAALKALGFTC